MTILEATERVSGPSGMSRMKVINYKVAAWALEVQAWRLAANLTGSSSLESSQRRPHGVALSQVCQEEPPRETALGRHIFPS